MINNPCLKEPIWKFVYSEKKIVAGGIMASRSSSEYYADLREMSPIRAISETLLQCDKVRKVTIAEVYEIACRQPGVSVTDMPIYPKYAQKHGLPEGAKVLNDCHGKIVGRTAKARRFYQKLSEPLKTKVEGDFREAVYQMQKYPLIRAEAVIGMDSDLMIKAHFVAPETDAVNMLNWLMNFVPYEHVAEVYEASPKLPILDIQRMDLRRSLLS